MKKCTVCKKEQMQYPIGYRKNGYIIVGETKWFCSIEHLQEYLKKEK